MLLSLELTRSHVAAILANQSGQTLQVARHEFRVGLNPASQWLELIKLARDLCFREVVDTQRLSYIGLAFEGNLSPEGRVMKSSTTQGWENYDLPRGLREHLGAPGAFVLTASRVMAEAIGEHRNGVLQGQSSFLFVHLGRFLESVACIGGYWLESDLASIVVERDGILDDFGRRGTLGAYCGGLAFESRARTYSIPFVQAHELWPLAQSNFAAHSLVEDFVSRLAQGLAGALALLKPQKICISGGFGRTILPLIEQPLALKLREVALPRAVENLEIKASLLGDAGATQGMLALSLEALARRESS